MNLFPLIEHTPLPIQESNSLMAKSPTGALTVKIMSPG